MSKGSKKKPVAPRLHFARPYVEGFKDWLRDRGYTANTITEKVRLLAGWADWMAGAGYRLDTIVAGHEASRSAFIGKKSIRRHVGSGTVFIRYLRHRGVVAPPPALPTPSDRWPLIGAFRAWMREHRGVADSTLDNSQRDIVALLEALGSDPKAYTTPSLRFFVRRRCKRFNARRAQAVGVAMRAFLRFLIANGQCPAGRDRAIPDFADWKLASIPRYLPQEDVERAIAACDGERRLRDKAIVLLLARLGLRAGEVAALKIADIDWKNGRLAINGGKSRRADWLPLTQEVGDAILAYLRHARPRLATPLLFLTEFAPLRPVTRITIKCVVGRTLVRAGIESPSYGAHVLRHSAATAMLRQGVSLDGVRAVLRHTSPSMTMHYAKVDIGLLSEIAQPWAGRPSC